MSKKENVNYVLQPDSDLGLLLWQASNKWQRELKRVLDKHNLTHVQYILLAGAQGLNGMKKDTTQMSLALFAGTDKMMASKVLRTLEKKMLIKRMENSRDSRAMQIEITSFGKVTLAKAAAEVKKFDRLFFAPVAEKQKGFVKRLQGLTTPK